VRHCNFCKYLTGSAFLLEAGFNKEDVDCTKGIPSVFEYKSPVHGRTLYVDFCASCSTKTGLRLERFPARHAVIGGSYDDPTWLKPEHHVFIEAALPWVRYPDDVNLYDKNFFTPDGVPAVPVRPKVNTA
jgi:hypothetical protein